MNCTIILDIEYDLDIITSLEISLCKFSLLKHYEDVVHFYIYGFLNVLAL